jgi:prevent-host-death family protein
MKTATARDLRNRFADISRWVEEGEEIIVTKRGRAFARILPAGPPESRTIEIPDFAQRVKRLFGRKRLTAKQSEALRVALRGDR